MGYLKDKKAYLCGPIKMASDDGKDWREIVASRLSSMGVNVINPCEKTTDGLSEIGDEKERFRKLIIHEKWGEIKKEFWPIVRYDLRSIDRSDFIILNYDPDIPTVGTVHELVVATFEKKIVLLKYDESKLSNFNPWMCVFVKEHHFFNTWDKMFLHLKEVNEGRFDTSLWVL